MTKNELINMILNENRQENSLKDLIEEIRALRNDHKRMEENFNAKMDEIATLKSNLQQCFSIINKQQTFLEMVDAENRSKNVVVFGVEETEHEEDEETEDRQKLTNVFEKINVKPVTIQCKRLGKKGRNPRPMIVTLNSSIERKRILENAKKLKEQGNCYRKVYIKKDQHPAIRREYARLRTVEKIEKDKPQNQGIDISFNRDDRTLRRNGIIIDRFSLNFA